MTLSAIAKFVCNKLGKTDASSINAAKDFIRQRHEMVVDTGLWKDTLVISEFDLPTRESPDTNPYTANASVSTSYEEEFTLPYEIARPINIIYDDQLMAYRDLQSLVRTQPDQILGTGKPVAFTEIEPVALSKLTSSEPFKIQLKAHVNSSDSGKTIYFKGKNNSRPVSESLTLSSSNYYGAQDFDEVHYVSKEITAGDVLFSNGASTETIPADSTKYSLCRVRLNLNPDYVDGETIKIIVVGKKRVRPLRHDYDEPQVRGIDNAIISFCEGDMLERARQYGKAQVKYSEASSLLEIARDIERGQSAAISTLQPNVNGEYDRHDFGF